MPMHRLSDLLTDLSTQSCRGPLDTAVRGISFDSRRTEPGFVFFAIQGEHVDGHSFIPDAVKRGACAVVYSDSCPPLPDSVTAVHVSDVRLALSHAASAWSGHPSRQIPCIGVTGTDGKSTTVHLLWQLLNLAGYKAGCVSTVHLSTGGGADKNPFRQSTPEAPEIHRILTEMIEANCQFAVVEATSHGLSDKTNRLRDVHWAGAVFTNLGHEHLEFHGSFENYRHDKCNLFRGLSETTGVGPFGIVNSDDPSESWFRRSTQARTYGISMAGAESDLKIQDIRESAEQTRFSLKYKGEHIPCTIRIPGRYNVFNTSAALLAGSLATGEPIENFARHAGQLRAPTGRMDEVKAGQPYRVIVDFAHTPGSFETVLPMLRTTTERKLIIVFGSAGERDTAKRPMQGSIADAYTDMVFLTDEDPRGEDREAILREIAAGCTGKIEGRTLFLIPDRRDAIRTAFESAEPGDTVALLGKGHESSIIYDTGSVPWNERDVACSILSELGYDHE